MQHLQNVAKRYFFLSYNVELNLFDVRPNENTVCKFLIFCIFLSFFPPLVTLIAPNQGHSVFSSFPVHLGSASFFRYSLFQSCNGNFREKMEFQSRKGNIQPLLGLSLPVPNIRLLALIFNFCQRCPCLIFVCQYSPLCLMFVYQRCCSTFVWAVYV